MADFSLMFDVSSNSTITLPIRDISSQLIITWGDGNTTTVPAGSLNHIGLTKLYLSAGIYTVNITGAFKTFGNGNNNVWTGSRYLYRVIRWGSSQITSFSSAFTGCTSLVSVPLTIPIGVTDMTYMFSGATAFNQDLSGWDVSTVTLMGYMFYVASNFNGNISNWDVSSVTSMGYMFAGSAFKQNINRWNVSKVTLMMYMFVNSPFNQDLSGWDVSSVTDMTSMFQSANAFNQNISSWKVSKVTTMNSMFHSATAFNQNISSWDVSNVTDMYAMFYNTSAFNQDLSIWNVSSVRSMKSMFHNASAFNQNLSAWRSKLNSFVLVPSNHEAFFRDTSNVDTTVSSTRSPFYRGLPSVPLNLSASVTGSQTVQLRWNEPTNIGDISAWYDISGSYGVSRTVSGFTTTFTGLTDGSSYTFYIKTCNKYGSSSQVITTVRVGVPPSVPLYVSSFTVASQTVQLLWTAPATLGDISAWYDVSGSYGISRTVYDLTTTFTGLTDGSAYTFYVNTRNTFGSSAQVVTTVLAGIIFSTIPVRPLLEIPSTTPFSRSSDIYTELQANVTLALKTGPKNKFYDSATYLQYRKGQINIGTTIRLPRQ